MKAGVEFCRMKGYRRIYGHAQKDLLGYYVKMGWKQLEGSSDFFFSDYPYVEIVIDTDSNPNASGSATIPTCCCARRAGGTGLACLIARRNVAQARLTGGKKKS